VRLAFGWYFFVSHAQTLVVPIIQYYRTVWYMDWKHAIKYFVYLSYFVYPLWCASCYNVDRLFTGLFSWLLSSVDIYFTLSVCCVMYWTRIQACLQILEGMILAKGADRQVSISEYLSSFAFSQLFMASLTRPIKCLVLFNKGLTTVLFCTGKKITEVRAYFASFYRNN